MLLYVCTNWGNFSVYAFIESCNIWHQPAKQIDYVLCMYIHSSTTDNTTQRTTLLFLPHSLIILTHNVTTYMFMYRSVIPTFLLSLGQQRWIDSTLQSTGDSYVHKSHQPSRQQLHNELVFELWNYSWRNYQQACRQSVWVLLLYRVSFYTTTFILLHHCAQ